jgi:acetyl esterase/lipase
MLISSAETAEYQALDHQKLSTRRSIMLSGAALAVAGCSPAGTLNTLAGQDAGSARSATNIPFGPHPRQLLDVYTPERVSRPAPVVCFLYGGSWNSGAKEDYAFVGHALAARGFVTVIPDYRLVPEVVYPDFLNDNAAAVRWIRDTIGTLGGDPRRLALVGHSAGAYNATMLGLDQQLLRQAGVTPSMIKAVVGLSGPYDFLPFTSSAARAAMGQWPRPAETQPINRVRAGAPPMFLATGDADTTVNAKNTRAMTAALRAAGSSVTERIYQGVGHAGTLTALSRNFRGPVLDDVVRFLGQQLGMQGR